MKKKLELLAPAGDWERLEMAVAYGADAVYLAGTTFGMRSFAGNFSPEELKKAAAYCKAHGVDCHVTCNTMPRNDEVARLPQWLELLEGALAARSGMDAASTLSRRLSTGRSSQELLGGIRSLKKALDYARSNVSPAAVCGWLEWALQ